MDIRQKLKQVREDLHWSQARAAENWKVSKRTLQEWEQGRRSPRGLALKHLQMILERALRPARRKQGALPPAKATNPPDPAASRRRPPV